MAEGDEVDLPDPDERLRPQVPAWLYYAVILEADDEMAIDTMSVRWWKCLEGLMGEKMYDFDPELYKDLLREGEDESERLRDHRHRY